MVAWVACLRHSLTAVAYAKFASRGAFLSFPWRSGDLSCQHLLLSCRPLHLVVVHVAGAAVVKTAEGGTGAAAPREQMPNRHAANAAPRIFGIDASSNPPPRPVSQVGAGVLRSPSSKLGPRSSGTSPSGRVGRKWGPKYEVLVPGGVSRRRELLKTPHEPIAHAGCVVGVAFELGDERAWGRPVTSGMPPAYMRLVKLGRPA
jgi:hypothetical protein